MIDREKPRRDLERGFHAKTSSAFGTILARSIGEGKGRAVYEIIIAIQAQWQKLRQLPAGATRARLVNKKVSAEIDAMPKRETPCKAGCADCCHLWTDITPDETALLTEIITRGQLPIDLGLLDRQAAVKSVADWSQLPKAERRCVFLSEANACRIYRDRPAVCRTYFVKGNAAQCEDIKGRSERFIFKDGEIAAAAALNLWQNPHEHLPKALARAIQKTQA